MKRRIVLLALTFLFTAFVSAAAAVEGVRPSALAGTWYPAAPDELSAKVRQYLAQAKPPPIKGSIKALVVPHAGHVYSGPAAAHAYALIKGAPYSTVILVGPSHRASFPGVSVDLLDYETPLGLAEIDRALAKTIMEAGKDFIGSHPEAQAKEHCLEIQLPFLQTVLDKPRIVPILMGSQDLETCRKLAAVLAEAVAGRSDVLILCSTDLSHFHPAEEAARLDNRLIEKVRAWDPEALHDELAKGKIEACGGGALVAVMMAAQALGADRAEILNYDHSGRTGGDDSSVVGYLAAAFTSKADVAQKSSTLESRAGGVLDFLAGLAASTARAEEGKAGLNDADKKTLLTIARRAIEDNLDGKPAEAPADLPASLRAPCGAFVTLKREGELRGCIGRISAEAPLAEVVAEMAVQAAFYDPRFAPLQKEELEGLSLEISVLAPFERVKDVSEIEVGVHGLIMERGFNRGLLLPQVPVEQGWNREEFLDNTCLKAGLPPGAWREPDCEIYSFSAQVFGEEDFGK